MSSHTGQKLAQRRFEKSHGGRRYTDNPEPALPPQHAVTANKPRLFSIHNVKASDLLVSAALKRQRIWRAKRDKHYIAKGEEILKAIARSKTKLMPAEGTGAAAGTVQASEVKIAKPSTWSRVREFLNRPVSSLFRKSGRVGGRGA